LENIVLPGIHLPLYGGLERGELSGLSLYSWHWQKAKPW
jgi:hypothetical protein